MMDDSQLHGALTALAAMRASLHGRLVERDEVIDGMIAALLAGEHVLLLGPVGTAKSMLASALCQRLHGATFFSVLLTKFSTPDEVFGPVSLVGLEHDEYRRVTDGKLPSAHIAFLDEVFKASSAILNSLLAVMNERVFHNGGQVQTVPLNTLVGASNELPEEGELVALYDRFLVRYVVDYIQEDFRFLKMLALEQPEDADGAALTLAQLEVLRRHTRQVVIADGTLGDIVELRRRLGEREIVASDRRYRQALGLLRGYAVLRGRDRVIDEDVAELRHVLWSDPSEREEVRLALEQLFRGHLKDARDLLAQGREVRAYALRTWPEQETAMRAAIEAHTKLKNLLSAAEKLLDTARRRGRAVDEVADVVAQLNTIQREVLAHSMHA